MQGNSLVEDFNGIKLDINQKKVQGDLFENSTKIDELINKIHDIQNNFSVESNYKRKNNLKLELEDSIIDFFKYKSSELKNISSTQSNIIDNELKKLIKNKEIKNFFPWRLYFAQVFREKGGFDIIIANPPYSQLRNQSRKYQESIKNSEYFYIAKGGRLNLFQFFMPLCINIAKQNGIICTITQNSIREDTAINNRNYIFDNCKIISFDSFPERDNVKKEYLNQQK